MDGHLEKLSAMQTGLDISIHLSPGTPSLTAVSITSSVPLFSIVSFACGFAEGSTRTLLRLHEDFA